MLFLCNIASVAQRTFKIVQKSRSREHGDIIISTRMYVDCVRLRESQNFPCEVPRDVSRKLQLTLSVITACLMVKLRFILGRVITRPLAHWNGFTCKRASEVKTLSR